MRFSGTGKHFIVGLIGQLAIVNSVFGLANVPKDFFDEFIERKSSRDAFVTLGNALADLVGGMLGETGTGGQTLPTTVTRLTTRLRDAAETITGLDLTTPEALEQYSFTSPAHATAAASALMTYRAFVADIPHATVLPGFSSQPVPIPQNFWNPQDKAPETYSVQNPAQIFPILEKLSRYIANRGIQLDDYKAVIQWVFFAHYDAANQTEDLDIYFFEQFLDGIRALSSNVHDVLGKYVNLWFEISTKFKFGGGLDEGFYEDQRELQGYLEARSSELKAVMAGFWGCHGFLSAVRIYEPFQEKPKTKGKKKKDPAATW
ncbi:hypothetical protein TWF281_010401 [Arthrobotrys megalospora]